MVSGWELVSGPYKEKIAGMKQVPPEQLINRMRAENPWWESDEEEPSVNYSGFRERPYFNGFIELVRQLDVRRAVLLMGPRRVGKTVFMHQAVRRLLVEDRFDRRAICYLSIDHPIYNGCMLEDLLRLLSAATQTDLTNKQTYIFFDEIQYLRGWETQLKVLVDNLPNVRFVASGSAAAALRLRNDESGAGRFTDFLLPALAFYEYLYLLDCHDLVEQDPDQPSRLITQDIQKLNQHFVKYLNFGGYPEVVFSETIQADPGRFIKHDIVDKVLLRDLPGLYGIQDIQELNYLFTTLAFNSGNEISLGELSKNSGVAKNTIKRYMEYLEAAFLIKVVHRIDRSGKRFQRANFFKVYLTNPSIRCALFAPIKANDPAMGGMAETGIFSQWFHYHEPRFYARWQGGEVDIVGLGSDTKPKWVVEIKWSDHWLTHHQEVRNVVSFYLENQLLDRPLITSLTHLGIVEIGEVEIRVVPTSLYCYTLGRNLIKSKSLI